MVPQTLKILALLLLTSTVTYAVDPVKTHVLVVGSDGKPTTTLDLSGSHVVGLPTVANLNGSVITSGQVAPARLGTGTPSSATVLRGDGAWVGTTPTGNTVAATSSLLMGDGAGNAAGVASGADLHRVFKTRLESAQAAQTVPVNLLAPGVADGFGFTFGSLNADGTITIPANGYIQWTLPGTAGSPPLYAYAVATTETAASALTIYALGVASSTSTPLPGVYRGTYATPAGNYLLRFANNTSAPLTIYFPALAALDAGLSLLASYADRVTVPVQPVADLDFTRFASADRTSRFLAERQTTVAVDSVNGSSGNAGTLYAPKLSLQQTVGNGATLGLYRGSVFRESLPLATLGTTHGIVVQDVALGAPTPLPVISALDPVNTSVVVDNGNGTYNYTWTGESALANDGYQNVYVVEISTETEARLPVAARRRMTDVTSAGAVVPGSAYVQSLGGGQWRATFRSTDSILPGDGHYRYEVVARSAPATWGGSVTNPGDGAMSGLALVGSNLGSGSLLSPLNFLGDRLVILHATTHQAVVGSGSLQRSVFYEGGDDDSIMLAWYTPTATGKRWDMRHGIFYNAVGDRSRDMVIAHSAGSTSYERGDISDWAFIGGRWANGSLHGTAIKYDNVAAGTINRVYVQSVHEILGYNMPLAAEVENSVFRDVRFPRVGCNFHDNLVLAQSGGDPSSYENTPRALLLQQNGASATNNLLWAHALPDITAGGNQFVGGLNFYPGVTSGTVQRNIIILDPVNTTDAMAYANFPAGAPTGFAIDYNLVISLAKAGTLTLNGTGLTFGWAGYRAQYPTLDAHSLFVDLSNDPRGLKALFVDPINGDFRWAQTDVAQRCAAYCAANHVGPATVTSRWPTVPSVDEAVRLISSL